MAVTSTIGPRCEMMKQLYEANQSRGKFCFPLLGPLSKVSDATLGMNIKFWEDIIHWAGYLVGDLS